MSRLDFIILFTLHCISVASHAAHRAGVSLAQTQLWLRTLRTY